MTPNRPIHTASSASDVESVDNESTMADCIKERRIEEETDDDGNASGEENAGTATDRTGADGDEFSSHKSNLASDGNKSLRNSMSCSKRTPNMSYQQRKRLVSTSLTKTPVIDGALIDYHDHQLKDGQDPFDLKYKLYAVVVSI